MKKYLKSIKSFFSLSICFTVLLFCVKTFELFTTESLKAVDFIDMILSNFIASLFISFCVFVIHNIITAFSKKTASYVTSILFSITIIAEFCLIFYHKSTGLLMGNELIERPLWETVHTVKSTLNLWMIAATILFVAGFTFVSIKIVSRQQPTSQGSKLKAQSPIVFLILMIISIPAFFILKPSRNENAVNKIWYCFHSCFMEKDNISLSRLDYDNEKIMKYMELFPEREVADDRYPLERIDNVNNVLGEYFKKSANKPNVVFIVVESLGANLFGVNEYGYTFTPFLDSLSKHSLLWTNCLSTTPRSFGAVPATTGSVPHGLKGFQFGDIPEYNSLFSVLKNNGYETSAFYAGEYSFDKIYDYLVLQKIDFMAPLFEDQKKTENKNYDYTYWGYHDKVMFEKSMQIMEKRDKNKPYFDLFMTVSQHDNKLRLNDKAKTDKYHERVAEIISLLPDKEQSKMNDISGHLAATIYGDEAIRHFVKRYSEYYDEGNYIFVITGDHSLNTHTTNPLDAFHVPLIIWSPMLEKTGRFNSVVSHNDIVPTLNALLRDNYNLDTPEKIHWMGEELDTIKEFHCDLKTCFLRYTRKITDGIYGDYYYTFTDGTKKLYQIRENLKIEEITDKEIISDIDDKFSILIYADNYAYTNNKVTKYPLFPHDKYNVIKDISIDSIYCASLPEKPSVMQPKMLDIFSTSIRQEYSEIKIVMTADLKYTGHVWQDQFINLGINFKHDNQENGIYDKIAKSFVDREHHPNKWMKIEFTKIFHVKDFKDCHLEIYLKPTTSDKLWNPEHSITLKNINIKILAS